MDDLNRTLDKLCKMGYDIDYYVEYERPNLSNQNLYNEFSSTFKYENFNTLGDFVNDSFFNNNISSENIILNDKELFSGSNKNISYKNFNCPHKNCNKSFTSAYGLKYHMDHGHAEEKTIELRPYSCQVPGCRKSYKKNNGLKYHIKHAHTDLKFDEFTFKLQ